MLCRCARGAGAGSGGAGGGGGVGCCCVLSSGGSSGGAYNSDSNRTTSYSSSSSSLSLGLVEPDRGRAGLYVAERGGESTEQGTTWPACLPACLPAYVYVRTHARLATHNSIRACMQSTTAHPVRLGCLPNKSKTHSSRGPVARLASPGAPALPAACLLHACYVHYTTAQTSSCGMCIDSVAMHLCL